MSLTIASLNSGSNGNCYYIGSAEQSVLIDAGISCRETERRMLRAGLAIHLVKAIFISHEHTDHTRGAEVLSRKHRIPVYITRDTLRAGRLQLEPGLVNHFAAEEEVNIGQFTIRPVAKWHDAAEPHSFTITGHGTTVGVFTDIGTVCNNVAMHMSKCDAAFLESNYDEVMLERGRYPEMLKRRIRGAEGHLSNSQALDLFLSHSSPRLRLLILSHLSAENNRPEIVHELFSRHANGTKIVIAPRHQESEVFRIKTAVQR